MIIVTNYWAAAVGPTWCSALHTPCLILTAQGGIFTGEEIEAEREITYQALTVSQRWSWNVSEISQGSNPCAPLTLRECKVPTLRFLHCCPLCTDYLTPTMPSSPLLLFRSCLVHTQSFHWLDAATQLQLLFLYRPPSFSRVPLRTHDHSETTDHLHVMVA